MNKTFSKSYIIPILELILDYIVLNDCLLNTTCLTYADNIPYPAVKSVIPILFKLKPKFFNSLPDQNTQNI